MVEGGSPATWHIADAPSRFSRRMWPIECFEPCRSSLMRVRVRSGKGKRTEAFARFHRVLCDQPFDDGGMDDGMTPPELLLCALGCGAMQDAAEYLRSRRLPLAQVDLTISAVVGERPGRLMQIGIEVNAPGLTTRARHGLIKVVEASLLHRTFEIPPEFQIRLATPLAESDGAGPRDGLAI
jgi:putative redox protein